MAQNNNHAMGKAATDNPNDAVVKALQVMVLDRDIRRWLGTNDPNALKQAEDALKGIGVPYNPYPVNLGLSIR